MNKAELVEALAVSLGDKRQATAALDAVLKEIQNAVTKGDRVAITGFGVFEKVDRAARTGRNPRTGETVKVKKTSVPKFRPGTQFKGVVNGTIKMGKVADAATKAAAKSSASTARSAAKTAVAGPRKATTAAKKAATKAAKAPAKKAPAKKAPAKKAPAKKATSRR